MSLKDKTFERDIIENEQIKQLLYQDNLVLDSIFKSLSDLFFLMDSEGTIIDYRANDKSDLYEQPENFINQKMQDVLPSPVGELFNENRLAILNDGEMSLFEYELLLNNIPRQFQARLTLLPEIKKLIMIVQDITEHNQTLAALKHSEALYRQMFEKNQAIKLILDPENGDIIEANSAALNFYGYSYQEMISKKITDINIMSEQEIKREMLLAKQQSRIFCNFRHKTASGEIKDVEVYSGPITIAGKTLLYSIVQDVTKKKEVEKNLQQKEQQLEDMFNHFNAEIFIKNLEGEYIAANVHFLAAINKSLEQVLGKTDDELYDQEKAQTFKHSDRMALEQDKTIKIENKINTDKGVCYCNTVKFPLKNAEGKTYAICGIATDITEQKLAQEKILHQAHYDALTQLPNRFLSLDRLTQLLNQAQRTNEVIAVLFLDLDDFKKVNDTLGHEVGDKLLIESAARLQKVVRAQDTVGRLGGDEFIVLLRNLTKQTNAQQVAEALLHAFRKPFNIDNRELILTLSVGIALYPEDAQSASELLRNADVAMYHAKELGRNNFSFFTPSMNNDASRRLLLEEHIRGALERNEFEVHYQAQISIKNHKMIGAEALLRWHNPVLGNVPPDEFIAIAEQTGLIVPLGEFVLKQALLTIQQWHKLTNQDLRIAVNLSPRQFRDPNLVQFIQDSLEKTGVLANNLELEITEGVLMSGHSYIDEALQSLNELGIVLSMDDFGTGYSSLSYLRNYPFNVLKIDRSFVSGITDNYADKELVNATIAMSHALGVKVVAEGVETKEQYQMLASLQCDYAQGYLLSKPVPQQALFSLGSDFSTLINH